MTFIRDERYWIRRSVGVRFAYLNSKNQETIAPVGFGENWTNGQPAAYPLRKALKLRDRVNSTVDRDAHYDVAAAGDSYNN